MIDFKDWSNEQTGAAWTAIKAHISSKVDHSLYNQNAAQVVFNRVITGELRAAFIEGYLLIYDVGPTWCTTEDLLYELLLLRALPTGNFGAYVAGIQQLAAQHGCIGVMTGNSVLRPGLRRLYEKAGFFKFSESYYMEVSNGSYQESG